MKLYRINRNREIVESGDCDLPRALQVLQECYDRGLKTYVAGEEAISETSFGLQTHSGSSRLHTAESGAVRGRVQHLCMSMTRRPDR